MASLPLAIADLPDPPATQQAVILVQDQGLPGGYGLLRLIELHSYL